MSEATALGGPSGGSSQSGTQGTATGSTPPPAVGASGTDAGGSKTGTSAAGSGASTTWRDTLPEDIRGNPAISMFSDVESLVKSHIHAQSQLGKKGAIIPGEKATDADWSAFYKAIGVPEADKYTIKAPEGIDAEVLNGFKDQALKNGLLPKQAEALLNWYHQFDQQSDKVSAGEYKLQVQKNLESLKTEWGEGYEKQLSAARMAVKEFGGDELIKYLNETGAGNDPQIIKAFAKAATLFSEDKLREGGITDGRMTPQDIKDQIQVIQGSPEYRDGKHPGHTASVTKMASLYKTLTGGR